MDLLKAKLEVAKMATAAGSKRKRQDADVVPYSREVKKGRKEAEEKREVFLGVLMIAVERCGLTVTGLDARYLARTSSQVWKGRVNTNGKSERTRDGRGASTSLSAYLCSLRRTPAPEDCWSNY